MNRIGWVALLGVAAASAVGCAAERTPYVPDPEAGKPAYWESALPVEPGRPITGPERRLEEGVGPEREPEKNDGEDEEGPRTPPEKFLWQDGPPPGAPNAPNAPAQQPHRQFLQGEKEKGTNPTPSPTEEKPRPARPEEPTGEPGTP